MERVAIVCHDAGGAEILSSWLNRSGCPCSVAVSGPAVAIFKRKCPQAEFLVQEEALSRCSWVLCGTGWQSDFERRAISLGRLLGKKTVAFLDHWVNYQERFFEAGDSILPDEIWVGDIYAEHIAKSLFRHTPIILQANPYVEDMLEDIARLKTETPQSLGVKVLYVCEPIGEHAKEFFGNERHWGYTENDALHFFMENLAVLNVPIDLITVRPHPSELPNKYSWLLDLEAVPIVIGGGKTLLEEILEADLVVGCESMAMIVGLLAGRRVISSIPLDGRSCQLPHIEIEKLSSLVAGAKNN